MSILTTDLVKLEVAFGISECQLSPQILTHYIAIRQFENNAVNEQLCIEIAWLVNNVKFNLADI